MKNNKHFERGFTLIEVLVTLLIVSVGMLALGAFFTTSIHQEGVAQERIAAVHMAEQIIEAWQDGNAVPTPDCTVSGAVPTLVIGTTTTNCRASNGVPVAFDLTLREAPATAPLPTTHPNNGTGAVVTGNLLSGVDPYTQQVIAGSTSVKVRTVTVAWTHGGQSRSVFLSHITRFF